MSLKYIILFDELLEITKKIIVNTTSVESKQIVAPITNIVRNEITATLLYHSKNGYTISHDTKSKILARFKEHKEQLYTQIERLGLRKECNKCGRDFPTTPR
ncbi:MAG: hypothetical protein ACFFG0_23915 [Candidatus Thorarchaeota archaeon]